MCVSPFPMTVCVCVAVCCVLGNAFVIRLGGSVSLASVVIVE